MDVVEVLVCHCRRSKPTSKIVPGTNTMCTILLLVPTVVSLITELYLTVGRASAISTVVSTRSFNHERLR